MAASLGALIGLIYIAFKWLFRGKVYERYLRIESGPGVVWLVRTVGVTTISAILFLTIYLIYDPCSFIDPKWFIFIYLSLGYITLIGLALQVFLYIFVNTDCYERLWKRNRISAAEAKIYNEGEWRQYFAREDWWFYIYGFTQWKKTDHKVPFHRWHNYMMEKHVFRERRRDDLDDRIKAMNYYGYK